MDAIDLLKSQIVKWRSCLPHSKRQRTRERSKRCSEELADSLAGHASIEEHQFYPAVRAKRTEDILLESLEEHLGIKRVLADLLKIDAKDKTFAAKIKVLKEQVEHHVSEEEKELFPKVKKVLDQEEIESLGEEMKAEFDTLEAERPREAVLAETKHTAPL